MDSPPEHKIDTELADDTSSSESQTNPADMDSALRRQYLKEMLKALPAPMQNRVVALKNLQLDQFKVEAEFHEEIYNLKKKYHLKYQSMFDKRKEIIEGNVDPAPEKPNWKEPAGKSEKKNNEVVSLKHMKSIPQDAKGIPDFWLTIFRNVSILADMVQEQDEPALSKLKDICIKHVNEHSVILEFHFDKNEFFSNAVLTKQYYYKVAVDPEDPFAYEGPQIYKCQGSTINWKKNINLTVKTTRKTQVHKRSGEVRVIVKEVAIDSCFNFFSPPDVSVDKGEVDDEPHQLLAFDYLVGDLLITKVIPKAVLYYTGDIIYNEDDGDEEELDESDEEESDETTSKTDDQ